MPKTYEEELAFAKDLAAHAGQIMKRYFRAEDIGTQTKEDNTPLTIADTKINNLVIERVKQEFPEHGVIGEEDSYETKRDFVWVVDPIDGTMPFSMGIPVSTFSLGLVDRKDGQPILGVAYDPYLNHLYSAVRGQGAFLNDKPIHTSKNGDLKASYSYVSGSHGYSGGKTIDQLQEKGGWQFHLLSFVYAAAKVASGEFVCATMGYGSPWDSAAAAIIVTEAGGVASDRTGKTRRYDEFSDGILLAANQKIHDQFVQMLKESKIS